MNTLSKILAVGMLAVSSAGVFGQGAAVSTSSLQVSATQAGTGSAYGNSANAELFFMVEQLQQEVQSLRGLVEELQHEVSTLKKQGRERYLDLDQRILDLSKAVPVGSASAARGNTAASDSTVVAATSNSAFGAPPSKQQELAYQQAYDLIKVKKFDEAANALHEFIGQYPENDLTVNAYYWLGEVYLVMPKLEQAKQAFTVVISKYPGHRKASDAMYKLGVVYDKLNDKVNAKHYLTETQRRYGGSSAAKLANDYKL